MKKTSCAIMMACLMAAPLAAQVTKEDIRKLAGAGISEEVILRYIRAHGPVEPMSADDLADLKLAGAGERVLAVLAEASPTSPTPGSLPPAPEAEAPAVLPQPSFVDYSQSAYTPLYSYYSAPSGGYCSPLDSYYYSPWFDYYYPSCGYAASCVTPGCCSSFGFGFPCYSSCFYPWWGGSFASFGWGHRSFDFCSRPFGFCSRPFGSFFSTTSRFHGSFATSLSCNPRFSSRFAASGPTIEAFRRPFSRTAVLPRTTLPFEGSTRLSLPATAPLVPQRPAVVTAPREWQTWSSAPARSFSGGSARSYSAPQSRAYAPVHHSSSSGPSGSFSHGGGQSHGGGGGGGGHSGGHGGGGHH